LRKLFGVAYSFILRDNPWLTQKHVLVYDGSVGIGLEISIRYLLKGYRVTIVAGKPSNYQEAYEILKNSFDSSFPLEKYLQYISCDVSLTGSTLADSLSPALAEFDDVDILVNSVATSMSGNIENDRVLQTSCNVISSVDLVRFVLPYMKQRSSGSIVFVSSEPPLVSYLSSSVFPSSFSFL
jgi:short-subunit dehydrogenase